MISSWDGIATLKFDGRLEPTAGSTTEIGKDRFLMLTSNFYEKIFICYGHRNDFKLLPESGLLMMALETCNASSSHDIDGVTRLLFALSLDDYPGENISNFATEDLR